MSLNLTSLVNLFQLFGSFSFSVFSTEALAVLYNWTHVWIRPVFVTIKVQQSYDVNDGFTSPCVVRSGFT